MSDHWQRASASYAARKPPRFSTLEFTEESAIDAFSQIAIRNCSQARAAGRGASSKKNNYICSRVLCKRCAAASVGRCCVVFIVMIPAIALRT